MHSTTTSATPAALAPSQEPPKSVEVVEAGVSGHDSTDYSAASTSEMSSPPVSSEPCQTDTTQYSDASTVAMDESDSLSSSSQKAKRPVRYRVCLNTQYEYMRFLLLSSQKLVLYFAFTIRLCTRSGSWSSRTTSSRTGCSCHVRSGGASS